MAQIIQDSPAIKKQSPKSYSSSGSCFPGCFCFSKYTRQKLKEKNKTTKCSSCFSRPKKSFKKSIPVGDDDRHKDDASSGKLHQKRNESFRMPKFSKKFSLIELPAAGKTQTQTLVEGGKAEQSQIPAAVTVGGGGGDEAGHGRADEKKGDEDNRTEINLENGNIMTNHSDSMANEPATYKKVAFFRRNSWSQPATSSSSSEQTSEISQPKAPVLTHSASMPAAPSAGDAGELSSEREEETNKRAKGKFDQLVGMSIIVVTLIVMMIWGKLCAILCTSAWLYFYPILLRSTKNDDHHHHQPNNHMMMMMRNGSGSLDALDNIESKKSKKKVVFQGFLERSQRARGG